jgi:hypothetical protein
MITTQQSGKVKRIELHEILANISAAKPTERVDLIRRYAEQYSSFSDYVRCVFDKKIEFLLPDSRPPFTPAKEESFPSSWNRQNVKLQYFVKGLKGDQVKPMKRESIYIGILETVHPKDAEILVDMIAKKTKCKGLTVKNVKEALPNLL